MVETFSVDVLRPLPLGEGWGEGLDGHNNPFVSSCPTLRALTPSPSPSRVEMVETFSVDVLRPLPLGGLG